MLSDILTCFSPALPLPLSWGFHFSPLGERGVSVAAPCTAGELGTHSLLSQQERSLVSHTSLLCCLRGVGKCNFFSLFLSLKTTWQNTPRLLSFCPTALGLSLAPFKFLGAFPADDTANQKCTEHAGRNGHQGATFSKHPMS